MNKEILRLAIPNILSNVTIPLLSTVDVALMGHLSTNHLAAIGLGGILFSFMYWNFGFLRMGTTGFTSQAYGASDQEKISQSFVQSAFIALGIAVLVIIAQVGIFKVGTAFLSVQEGEYNLLAEYFFILIWAAPSTLMNYVIIGWLFGLQDTIRPLIITVAINVLNIALSYLLVYRFQMDIRGAALGTLVSQYLGTFLGIFYILNSKFFDRSLLRVKISAERWKSFFQVNKHLFVRTLFLSAAFAFLYRESSRTSEVVLAMNVVLIQFLNWMSFGIDGFAHAAEAIVGKYYGSQKRSQYLKAIRLSFYWGFVLACIYSISYWLFGQHITLIFTDDVALIDIIYKNLYLVVILPPLAFICYIWDGVYIGFTKTKAMRDTAFLAFVSYLLTYYLLKNQVDNAVWIGMVVFLFGRGVYQTFFWYLSKEFEDVR